MNHRVEAVRAFCKLRRLQEANDAGYVKCFTCGRVMRWDDCDGGHFIHRRFRGTEVEHDNVWPQCRACNRFGNIPQKEVARKLIEKIGIDRVEALCEKKHNEQRWTDYKSMASEFRSEIRRIRKEKGL